MAGLDWSPWRFLSPNECKLVKQASVFEAELRLYLLPAAGTKLIADLSQAETKLWLASYEVGTNHIDIFTSSGQTGEHLLEAFSEAEFWQWSLEKATKVSAAGKRN